MGGAGDAGCAADAGQGWEAAVRQEGRGSPTDQPLGTAVLSVPYESAGQGEEEEREGGREGRREVEGRREACTEQAIERERRVCMARESVCLDVELI